MTPLVSQERLHNKLATSKAARVALLIVGLLYASVGGLGLLASVALEPTSPNPEAERALLRHCMQHFGTGLLCFAAFAFAARKARLADIVGGLAFLVLVYVVVKALGTGLRTGFGIQHLLEPLVVIPALIIVGHALFRNASGAKRDDQCLRPAERVHTTE
jgi:hypothetical protein